jgi:hypothetical protein
MAKKRQEKAKKKYSAAQSFTCSDLIETHKRNEPPDWVALLIIFSFF